MMPMQNTCMPFFSLNYTSWSTWRMGSCLHCPGDSWWVIRLFFLEGWHNQILQFLLFTHSPIMDRLASPGSLAAEPTIPGGRMKPIFLLLLPSSWWFTLQYYSHFCILKSSFSRCTCQKLLAPCFFSEKSWSVSTNCHLKWASVVVLLSPNPHPPTPHMLLPTMALRGA